jgi:hypothetical protein
MYNGPGVIIAWNADEDISLLDFFNLLPNVFSEDYGILRHGS